MFCFCMFGWAQLWVMTGLFSSSVSYQAKLPLHFSLYNFPPSTGKTCTFSASACACGLCLHVEDSSWRHWSHKGRWIYLPLLAFTCFPWSRWLSIFYSAFAFIMPKAYRSPLKSMQSRLSALCLRNSSFIRGSSILHTNLGAGGSPYH